MPIKVTCQCGRLLAAKDELAGRAASCPKCGETVQIPRHDLHNRLLELFDEAGMYGSPECPNCIPPHEVLCIKCGYDKELGRKMTTEVD